MFQQLENVAEAIQVIATALVFLCCIFASLGTLLFSLAIRGQDIRVRVRTITLQDSRNTDWLDRLN